MRTGSKSRGFSWCVLGLCMVACLLAPLFLSRSHAAVSLDLIDSPSLSPLIPVNPVIPNPAILCAHTYPTPQVSFVGVENYSVSGVNYVRYLLSVDNRSDYPDALFAPSPTLPPCGLNTNSARTWVGIFDQADNYLYGFCALGSADDMSGLWFAIPADHAPPTGVWVILWDRLCQTNWQDGYRSALVPIREMLGPKITEDLEVHSQYAAISPVIDGVVSSGEWNGAGTLPIYDNTNFQRGLLYVKNDDQALYFLLDMTGDPNAGSNPNDDYSGIAFDIGLDGFKSPYVDLKYATATGTENLGIQWVVSESGWTGVNPTSLSQYHEGFGPTLTAAANHKFYEYKIDYSEIGINFDDVLSDPSNLFRARINLRVASEQPPFQVYYPSSQYGSWHNPMIRIALGLGSLSLDPKAPIIAGIGLVPRTFIDQTTGLATTGSGDQIEVTDAPFGSHLRVIGNLDKLRSWSSPGPIRHYAIGYCNMELDACEPIGTSGFQLSDWTFVQDVITNYYWDGSQGKYVLDSVSPTTIYDAGGLVVKAYPVSSGALEWYFPNLLFDWRTTGTNFVNSGRYRIHFFGFAAQNLFSYIPTPSSESTMVVRIDNTQPVMFVNAISYLGNDVSACSIIRLQNANDPIEVNASAYDPDGFLYDFNLHALYGDNQSFTCHAETYEGYLADGGTGPVWQGAFPSQTYLCEGDAGDHWETTCGYTFRVTGWDRAINGYGRIHYSEGHRTITILMPDDPVCR
jgi:hypothetical protein